MPGWDETENQIRYRLQNPELFKGGSYRTLPIDDKGGPKEVALLNGKLKSNDEWSTQALRFKKKTEDNPGGWTLDGAKKWYEEHKDKIKASVFIDDFQDAVYAVGKVKKGEHPLDTVSQWPQVVVDLGLAPGSYYKPDQGMSFKIEESTPQEIIKNFEDATEDGKKVRGIVPIDLEHYFQGGSDPPIDPETNKRLLKTDSLGYVTKLWLQGKSLMARMALIPWLHEKVKKGTIRFVSGVFSLDSPSMRKSSKSIGAKLRSISFTAFPYFRDQRPALAMTNITASDGNDAGAFYIYAETENNTPGATERTEMLEKLRKTLGLDEKANDEAILKAAEEMIAELAEYRDGKKVPDGKVLMSSTDVEGKTLVGNDRLKELENIAAASSEKDKELADVKKEASETKTRLDKMEGDIAHKDRCNKLNMLYASRKLKPSEYNVNATDEEKKASRAYQWDEKGVLDEIVEDRGVVLGGSEVHGSDAGTAFGDNTNPKSEAEKSKIIDQKITELMGKNKDLSRSDAYDLVIAENPDLSWKPSWPSDE